MEPCTGVDADEREGEGTERNDGKGDIGVPALETEPDSEPADDEDGDGAGLLGTR